MSQTLADLSIGSKVKFGKYQVNTEDAQPIIWTIVAKNHTGYPENSVTLHATEILDLRCFDAIEPNNSDSNRATFGNNRYSVSNIDQWLNKNNVKARWYSAAHSADQSPNTSARTGDCNTQYSSRPGFLNAFTDDEIQAILSTTIRVVVPEVDGGSYEDIERKVFLPSVTEVGLTNENNTAEGANWGYYGSLPRKCCVTSQCFSNTLSTSKPSTAIKFWSWRLRTPQYSSSSGVKTITSTGSADYYNAWQGSYGIRPAINLSSSLLASDSIDSDDCYTITLGAPTGSDVTLNGNTYSGVTNINYVKNGTSYSLDKLIVNGSIIWTK